MQEHYYELVVNLSSHHSLFLDFLADTLPIGFEEIDSGFIIRSEDELDTIVWGLEQFAGALEKALGQNVNLECKQTKLKNSDWVEVYQNSVKSIEVDKFYIHQTWSEPSKELINIIIDPALAFGTGHHQTTASMLKAIIKCVNKTHKVLDVGCGSGILGIGALKLGAKVDACDTDQICIENSKKNAKLNNVEFENIWEGSCNLTENFYDIVIANIVADVLIFIANDLKNVLKEDGILILSGILDKYETKVLDFYKDFKIHEKTTQDEWVTIVLKKG
ncbi:MAG: 50S ribosomal protein L11 methyltransferase [Sulfurimonas sp.]|nr:50S ribosomal protein L11 methyltransferase [Sulfurimonas sp.]